MSDPIRSIITEKKYYLITNPHVPDLYIRNYGDRVFLLESTKGRWTEFPEVAFGGDKSWDITKENILRAGNFLLEEKLKERLAEQEAQKSKPTQFHWSQCQTCGDQIGLVGRFFHIFGLLHKCKK